MGFDYSPFGFDTMPGLDALEDAVIAILAVYLGMMLISSLYSILVYVLHSVGLYSIAKRRGIQNPWLAWIPLANLWTLGSVSDQYQYVTKGKVTHRRKVLIGLTIALYAIVIVFMVMALYMIFGLAADPYANSMGSGLVGVIIGIVVGYFALLGVAITLLVFQYIAYYDLYNSCNPNNCTVFLVLSIIFSFLTPYFVFAVRKKDLGMPPRREPAPVQVLPPVVEDIPAEPAPEVPSN